MAVIARVVMRDAKTTTGRNVLNLKIETSLDAFSAPLSKFRELFSSARVPALDHWKLYLLSKYLKLRDDLEMKCEDTNYINDLIDSLCSS